MKTLDVVFWITERELMRERKEGGLRYPYSSIPVMAHTRFTNVRREDDKVTKYLASTAWRKEWDNNIVFRMVLARFVNYIPSLDELLQFSDIHNPDAISECLFDRADAGERVWGAAYTITTCGRPMDKIDYLCTHVLPQVVALGPLPSSVQTLAACHKWLTKVDGLGSFLAAQVVADLKNIPDGPLSEKVVPDWMTWSAPGPGSLKGLSWFWGKQITPSSYEAAIRDAWACIKPKLAPQLQNLHMQDVQNVFCEVSKYARIKEGRGHARNKY